MVSAVFHYSVGRKPTSAADPGLAATGLMPAGSAAVGAVVGAAAAGATAAGAASVGATGAVATGAVGLSKAEPTPAVRQPFDWSRLAWAVLPPIAGIGLLILIWALATNEAGGFPTPLATAKSAAELFADPFYVRGPNDQGIGWNILFSLQRVAVGFGLAALVGIPLGFLIGRSDFVNRMTSPLISLLRPVSPLAWLPIGLLVFKAANPAAIWTIFICSIWPMVVNTAIGVQRVPQDYLNVARVLNLSEWHVATKILLPSVLPYMLTGVRLSIGTAWLVIVAAEMLTGGAGIGFWVWDEWNNLNVPHILVAILVIGLVGLLLEQALISIARRFTFSETH